MIKRRYVSGGGGESCQNRRVGLPYWQLGPVSSVHSARWQWFFADNAAALKILVVQTRLGHPLVACHTCQWRCFCYGFTTPAAFTLFHAAEIHLCLLFYRHIYYYICYFFMLLFTLPTRIIFVFHSYSAKLASTHIQAYDVCFYKQIMLLLLFFPFHNFFSFHLATYHYLGSLSFRKKETFFFFLCQTLAELGACRTLMQFSLEFLLIYLSFSWFFFFLLHTITIFHSLQMASLTLNALIMMEID